MTMRPRVIVHFGKHKTGTTSIQDFLARNTPRLAAAGVAVLQDLTFDAGGRLSDRPETNCAHLAHLVVRPELMTPLRLRGTVPILAPPLAEEALGRANTMLRARIGRGGIVSSETFGFLRTAAERRRFELLFAGFDVLPLGLFRAAPAWLDSWRAQVARMALPPGADAAAGRGIYDLRPDSWLVDDAAIRAFFGASGVYLDYDEVVAAEGSVLPAFCRATGLSALSGLSGFDTWKNPGPRRTG